MVKSIVEIKGGSVVLFHWLLCFKNRTKIYNKILMICIKDVESNIKGY